MILCLGLGGEGGGGEGGGRGGGGGEGLGVYRLMWHFFHTLIIHPEYVISPSVIIVTPASD